MEDLFSSSKLDVLVPDQRVKLESLDTTQTHWWSRLQSLPQRNLAFFDERLHLLLCTKLPSTEPSLLAPLLQRLQVSLDASYISPFTPKSSSRPGTGNSSAAQQQSTPVRPRNLNSALAQIIPPQTPNPVPSTSTPDRQYAQADPGVVLQSYLWGDAARPSPSGNSRTGNKSAPPPENDGFLIAWSEEEDCWIAMYELHVLVTFLQTKVSEPLLCLTASATLRDKPILSDSAQELIVACLSEKAISIEGLVDPMDDDDDEFEDVMTGMEEVNLLESLNSGPTFGASPGTHLHLTTSRVPESIRTSAFSLHARTASEFPDLNDINGQKRPKAKMAYPLTRPVLRKSYRRTMRTLEGVRVRMKNCFVPYVPTPVVDSDGNEDAEDEEGTAGSEERTVILSVEIENSEPLLGFVVDSVSLTISGGNAHATLIGWGDTEDVFPLQLKGSDQYNLLYRVSFLAAAEAVAPVASDSKDAAMQKRLSTMSGISSQSTPEAMRHYVAIDLIGHPFRPANAAAPVSGPPSASSPSSTKPPSPSPITVPKEDIHFGTYSSRWNCLLDLLTTQQADPPTFYNRPSSPLSAQNVMPTPASPFPVSAAKTALVNAKKVAVASPGPMSPLAPWNVPKRNSARDSTLSTSIGLGIGTPTSTLASSSLSPLPNQKFTPTSPSAVLAAMNAQTQAQMVGAGSPTPRSSRFPLSVSSGLNPNARASVLGSAGSGVPPDDPPAPTQIPPTPAFPSYPSDDASSIMSDATGIGTNPTFQAPLARGGFGAIEGSAGGTYPYREAVGNVIVTVNLIPPSSTPSPSSSVSTKGTRFPFPTIYPHDTFSLDIFVLNLSDQVRRCEVGWPTQKRRRTQQQRMSMQGPSLSAGGYAGYSEMGLMPVDNRIRVGPLLPGASQSIQMQVLALSPGIHMIDALTLTDVASSYTVTMRSVMTVVVSEPELDEEATEAQS